MLEEVERVHKSLVENNSELTSSSLGKLERNANGYQLIHRAPFSPRYSNTLSDFLEDERLHNLLEVLHNYESRIGENGKGGLVVLDQLLVRATTMIDKN